MGLMLLALVAIIVWALVRMGRQTERRGQAYWRVSATLLSAVLLAGAAVAAFKSSWLAAIGMAAAGLYMAVASRQRTVSRSENRSETLSEADARAVLGVGAGASAAEIQAAWKRAMARVHPDQGGTEGLAMRVNAARDRLLRK